MRQILIDELSRDHAAKLKNHLAGQGLSSPLDGLYWLDLPTDLLEADQLPATTDHPYCIAIEIGDTWAKFEFLVRSRTNLHSMLTRYASLRQQWFILDYASGLIEDLGLKT